MRNEYSPQLSKLLYKCKLKNKEAHSYLKGLSDSGVPRGDAQDARASPLPPCASPPPAMCIPPPQPERLVMRKDGAVGNKKKMQFCLPATC
jgi:hypothetical protein